MLVRHNKGYKPKFTFTADYHELVRGDLIPGPASLRYDPFRIVPPEEIPTLPATQRPVTAWCRFHPSGEVWTTEIRFAEAEWIQPDWDPTGQGTILHETLTIPEDAVEFEFWFSYADARGRLHYDSDFGKNLWLRFPSYDLQIESAVIEAQGAGNQSRFELSVLTVSEIDSLIAGWRYTALPNTPRQEIALIASAGPNGKKCWHTPNGAFPIPPNTPLALDIVYTSGGHSFFDDNDGSWYLVTTQVAT